jgi:hypothetical protein
LDIAGESTVAGAVRATCLGGLGTDRRNGLLGIFDRSHVGE